MRLRSCDRTALWVGSAGRTTFFGLGNWIVKVMKNKVTDESFSLMLEHFNEVTR